MGKKATGKNEKRKNTPFVGDKLPPARKKKKKRTGFFAGAGEETEPMRPGSAKKAPRLGRSTAACSPVGEHARR